MFGGFGFGFVCGWLGKGKGREEVKIYIPIVGSWLLDSDAVEINKRKKDGCKTQIQWRGHDITRSLLRELLLPLIQSFPHSLTYISSKRLHDASSHRRIFPCRCLHASLHTRSTGFIPSGLVTALKDLRGTIPIVPTYGSCKRHCTGGIDGGE